MQLTRRKILGAGAGLGVLMVAAQYAPKFLRQLEPFEVVAAFVNVKDPNRRIAAAFRWDALGNLQVIRSIEFSWAPHAFFESGRFLVATEKNGVHGAVFHRKSLEIASQLRAPIGLEFYGHGVETAQGARIVVSAFRPKPNEPEIYSQSGYLLEYEISPDGSTDLVEMHPTEGFVPHDFAFNHDATELAYTTKFTENQRSQIIVCDPVDFKTLRKIEIGLVENGLQRRLTHLLRHRDQIYYSFLEWKGAEAVGGGIGRADWNTGAGPNWEASYTTLMGERIAARGAGTLDLAFFDGAPVVVLNEVGSLLRLDIKTQKFLALDLPGVTGAILKHDGETLLTVSRHGIQKLNQDYSFTPLAPNSDPDFEPASHLFYGTA